MKKLLITLTLLFVFITAKAQTVFYKTDSLQIVIDKTIYPDFNRFMFMEVASTYNINLKGLTSLALIVGGGNDVTYFGLYDSTTQINTIFINSTIPYYLPSLRRAVLYHELAHHLLPNDKMHTQAGPYILQSGSNMDPEIVIRFWETWEKEYMNYLKAILNGNS